MLKGFIKTVGVLGGAAIAAMMLLILAEVLSRLFLDASIEGTIEIVGICLSMAVFLGFAPCEQSGHHVRVELLRIRMSTRQKRAMDLFAYFLALIIVVVMAWRIGVDAYISLKIREVLPGANFEVPVYPAKILAFGGFVVFCLQVALNLIRLLRQGASSRKKEAH